MKIPDFLLVKWFDAVIVGSVGGSVTVLLLSYMELTWQPFTIAVFASIFALGVLMQIRDYRRTPRPTIDEYAKMRELLKSYARSIRKKVPNSIAEAAAAIKVVLGPKGERDFLAHFSSLNSREDAETAWAAAAAYLEALAERPRLEHQGDRY